MQKLKKSKWFQLLTIASVSTSLMFSHAFLWLSAHYQRLMLFVSRLTEAGCLTCALS